MKVEYRCINELLEGDGFFYLDTAERLAQERRVNNYQLGLQDRLTGVEQRDIIESYSSGYLVYAITRAGERCTMRVGDDRRHIWYNGEIRVRVAKQPEFLKAELDELRRGKLKMEESLSAKRKQTA